MTNPLRVGQIGFGYWGKILHRNFVQSDKFNVVGVAVANPRGPRQDCNNLPVEVVSVDQLLARYDIDVVVVASPLKTHFELGQRVLSSGFSLMMEKPFTRTVNQGQQLKRLAEQRCLKLLVDYTFTFSPAIAKMIETIKSGQLGRISAIHLSMQQAGTYGREDVYTLIGCHMLSVLDMIVPLKTLNFERRDIDCRDGLVEEGRLTFQAQNGGLAGEISLSLNRPTPVREITVVGQKDDQRRVLTYRMHDLQGRLIDHPLALSSFRPEGKVKGAQITTTDFGHFEECQVLRDGVLPHLYWYLQGQPGFQSNIATAIEVNKALERAGV